MKNKTWYILTSILLLPTFLNCILFGTIGFSYWVEIKPTMLTKVLEGDAGNGFIAIMCALSTLGVCCAISLFMGLSKDSSVIDNWEAAKEEYWEETRQLRKAKDKLIKALETHNIKLEDDDE